MEKLRTYGAEIEKAISDSKTGKAHRVSQNFFDKLRVSAQERGSFNNIHFSDIERDIKLGVISSDIGEQGVDNGFNLLETSLRYQESLFALQELMKLDLKTIQDALKQEGASVINLSIHPLTERNLETYKAYVAPKGIYSYLWFRGWDHTAGIDARAQNSPTTGVEVWEAADAVSVIIGAGAAFVALFGNSPFEEGRLSNFKESRLMMWERMMKNAKVDGDKITAQFPPERFRTLAQYFNWMFGDKTGIHFVKQSGPKKDYKGIGDNILIILGNPSVLEYLSKPAWPALFLKEMQDSSSSKRVVEVVPDISHMEAMQFAQFTGGRIRYELIKEGFPIGKFLEACKKINNQEVENLFADWANYIYIEGRDAGANFPDREIWEAGDEIAQSVLIAPSAIQAGLIRNLSEAVRFIDSFNWQSLGALRLAAMKDGLQGQVDDLKVYDFTEKILAIASNGLTAKEQKMLEYPFYVLRTRKNGADRAIEFVESDKQGGDFKNKIVNLIKNREVVI